MKDTGVLFIPSGDDSLPIPTDKRLKSEAYRGSPIRLCLEDGNLLLKNWKLCPRILWPFQGAGPLPGVQPCTSKLVRDYLLIGLVTVVELLVILAAILVFFLAPGWMFLVVAFAEYLVIHFLAGLTWGSLVVRSQCEVEDQKFPNERWLFINGIATSHAMLQRSCDRIAKTFGRPVVGVHNRSYGVVLDLVECLIQRSLHYQTEDVRVAEATLKSMLEDDSAKKIVVIAHSQGGIILSLVLDRLFSILPAHLFSKLELYTFGSAAAQFHNPLVSESKARSAPVTPAVTRTPLVMSSKSALPEFSPPPDMSDRLIPTIEHYVNRQDLVPTWGVLYHIILGTGTTYSGRVFVHESASGHLFDEHYLGPMLPLLDMSEIEKGDKKCFLNHVARLSDSKGKSTGIWRAETFHDEAKARVLNGKPNGELSDDESIALPINRVQGMTVKELSRLWRYIGGRDV